jgi:poly-gamma-glutamate synthesis protein (capsule biosynthesis protein)
MHRADLVIPVMHWGWENERTANPRQRQLAKLMIDAGADAVIGGHPHVTQDVSVYKGKPIIYSVGNFVMKETDNAFQRQSWVLKMYLDQRGVTRFETLPVKIDMEGIPSIDRAASSPCWQRGDNIAGECQTAPVK